MKIAIYTLGCKVNQYETQAMEAELTRRGHTLSSFESKADAYIINTCTVTAVSDKKSRQIIRRARKENPEAVIGVCGCYAQTDPEAVKQLEVDLISGTAGRMVFLDDLEALLEDRRAARLSGEGPRMTVDNALRRRVFEILPAGGLEGRTRAMLKVEDGCVNFCTYCIIPYARGPIRSLSISEAEEQCRRLGEEGYREVVSSRYRDILLGSGAEGRHDPHRSAGGGVPGPCPPVPGCGWGAWSPGPSRRSSAAGRRPSPTSALTSICPCRADATVCSGG